VFESFGGGVPLNRRGPRRRAPSGVVDYNSGAYGDVGAGYRGGGISNTDVGGVTFGGGAAAGGPLGSQHSIIGGQKSPGSIRGDAGGLVMGGPGMTQAGQSTPSVTPIGLQPQHTGASGQTGSAVGGPLGVPVISPGAESTTAPSEMMPVRAKALYACALSTSVSRREC